MAMKFFGSFVKGSGSLIDMLTELNDEQKRKFKEKITNLSTDHPKDLLPSKKHRNVLCHGDLWSHNLLFKYDANRNPVDCCLIDFQLARYLKK